MWFCFNDVKQIVTTSFQVFIKLQLNLILIEGILEQCW
jgi:hypothetical protein